MQLASESSNFAMSNKHRCKNKDAHDTLYSQFSIFSCRTYVVHLPHSVPTTFFHIFAIYCLYTIRVYTSSYHRQTDRQTANHPKMRSVKNAN